MGKMKALAIVEQDSELKSLDEEFEAAQKEYSERMMFLTKQKEEAWKSTLGAVWNRIEKVLREQGALEEYDEETQQFHMENGVIYLKDKGDALDGVPPFLRLLFENK